MPKLFWPYEEFHLIFAEFLSLAPSSWGLSESPRLSAEGDLLFVQIEKQHALSIAVHAHACLVRIAVHSVENHSNRMILNILSEVQSLNIHFENSLWTMFIINIVQR